jgi:uncharacterized protein YceH (UPF0502 family)
MHQFAGLEEVNQTLQRLIARGLVERLDRRPGQKEERFLQLLEEREEAEAATGSTPASDARPYGDGELASSDSTAHACPAEAHASGSESSLHERVAKLEREVAELRAELDGPTRAADGEAVPAVHE